MERHSWGLALSGGGARGLIHLGVLQAMDELDIRPGCIAGTSIGAIVGAFYAAGMSPAEMLKHFQKQNWIRMFRLKPSLSAFLEMKYLSDMLESEVPTDFRALQIPFCCGVTNLNKRVYEVLSSGNVHDAVRASAAIPILFAPVKIEGQSYVDGGMTNNIPSAAIRDRCQKLIAVDVNHMATPKELSNVKEIAIQLFHTAVDNNSREGRELADVLIRPLLSAHYDLLDFAKSEDLFSIGYKTAMEQLREYSLDQGEQSKKVLSAKP